MMRARCRSRRRMRRRRRNAQKAGVEEPERDHAVVTRLSETCFRAKIRVLAPFTCELDRFLIVFVVVT